MLKIAWSPIYKYELPDGHRFPMEKYDLLPEQLLYEGTVVDENFFNPTALDDSQILLTHTPDYIHKLNTQSLSKKEIRNIGFPMTPRLVERGKHIANGTYMSAEYAIKYGIGMNIAGGTHHAFAERGEGFCIFNDIAISANLLKLKYLDLKILIVDLDVHQGNGTAKIFENDPNTYTFSMHGAKNYPLKKEFSDLDIGLPDGTNDANYLKILYETLPKLLDDFQPNFIFFLSGVDVLHTDKLGKLHLTKEGCRQRDKYVLQTALNYNIPISVVMGGGYSTKLADILDAHANTFRLAQQIFF